MINYDTGVNVSTESDNRYSELVIAQTSQTHSGNYSCVPNSAAPASTFVHIFNGKYFYLMDPGSGILILFVLMKEWRDEKKKWSIKIQSRLSCKKIKWEK